VGLLFLDPKIDPLRGMKDEDITIKIMVPHEEAGVLGFS
jgi:hypothetical protein